MKMKEEWNQQLDWDTFHIIFSHQFYSREQIQMHRRDEYKSNESLWNETHNICNYHGI